MTLEDRYVTPTPEGVSLDFVLAGLGSRIAAFTLDTLIQVSFFLVVLFVVGATFSGDSETTNLLRAGILSAVALLDFFGYFVALDLLWSGRSVGKRAAGTRVVRLNGTSVGFWSSLLRNVVRLVDMMPGFLYLVGSVLVLATAKNQRLGDVLGSTIVVRERQAATAIKRGVRFDDPGQWVLPPPLPPALAHWDVSAVPEADLVLIRRFLANRQGYTAEARSRLAVQLAGRVWPLVAGPVTPPHPEQFLEAVVMVKSARG